MILLPFQGEGLQEIIDLELKGQASQILSIIRNALNSMGCFGDYIIKKYQIKEEGVEVSISIL